MAGKVIRLLPGPEDSGLRLDQFVSSQREELTRTFLRKVIDVGGVHVGGRRTRRCSYRIRPGETVEIHLDGLPLEPFELDETRILFQDRYVLAIDKPSGIDSQPTPARFKGTVYDAVSKYLKDPFRPLDKPALGMVQRLDRGTSGIMVFSIHPNAHRGLTTAFSGRDVKKSYLAIIRGQPADAQGEIRSLLARRRATNRMKSVPRGGKEAITRYRVLEEYGEAALLAAEIPTGRTHQIRVHFAEGGNPVLGDDKYGCPSRPDPTVHRLMLHAHRLSFPHPVDGRILDIEAPLPEDMSAVLEALRRKSRTR